MSDPLHVCVVGYGYWGPKLVRNFLAAGARVSVCDADPERRRRAEAEFRVVTYSDVESQLSRFDIDAVVIATPPATHYDLTARALLAKKHVLVEKPLALKDEQARALGNTAELKGVTLMADHTFLYHPAVQRIKSAIDTGELGALHSFDSTRVNLGLVQKDCNVLWDLAVHDLSILLHLVQERPVSVSAAGRHEHAVLNLQYAGGLFATINVSWLSPVKVRRMMVAGSSALIWDDTNPVEPVKIYDAGIDKVADQTSYRNGAILSPKIGSDEALRGMVEDFLNCCRHGLVPTSSAKLARDVVYILEQAEKSLAYGKTMKFNPEKFL